MTSLKRTREESDLDEDLVPEAKEPRFTISPIVLPEEMMSYIGGFVQVPENVMQMITNAIRDQAPDMATARINIWRSLTLPNLLIPGSRIPIYRSLHLSVTSLDQLRRLFYLLQGLDLVVQVDFEFLSVYEPTWAPPSVVAYHRSLLPTTGQWNLMVPYHPMNRSKHTISIILSHAQMHERTNISLHIGHNHVDPKVMDEWMQAMGTTERAMLILPRITVEKAQLNKQPRIPFEYTAQEMQSTAVFVSYAHIQDVTVRVVLSPLIINLIYSMAPSLRHLHLIYETHTAEYLAGLYQFVMDVRLGALHLDSLEIYEFLLEDHTDAFMEEEFHIPISPCLQNTMVITSATPASYSICAVFSAIIVAMMRNLQVRHVKCINLKLPTWHGMNDPNQGWSTLWDRLDQLTLVDCLMRNEHRIMFWSSRLSRYDEYYRVYPSPYITLSDAAVQALQNSAVGRIYINALLVRGINLPDEENLAFVLHDVIPVHALKELRLKWVMTTTAAQLPMSLGALPPPIALSADQWDVLKDIIESYLEQQIVSISGRMPTRIEVPSYSYQHNPDGTIRHFGTAHIVLQ